MAQIQSITYPLNLGTADKLTINIITSSEIDGGKIFYRLMDSSITPNKMMSSGHLLLSEEQVTADNFDKAWALTYTAQQLGVTLTT